MSKYRKIIAKAKMGDYYTKTTLVYDIHLSWLMNYVENKGNIKMVECGVARGGCLALCHLANSEMKIFGLDSWEGMPNITEKDNADKCSPWVGCVNGQMEDVYRSYDLLGSSTKNLTLVKGWIQDTIPENIEILNDLDILRIDTDFYESIKFCLQSLYSKVKSGGLIIFDDWHFNPDGVQSAAYEFFEEMKINPKLEQHDNHGPVWFFKE